MSRREKQDCEQLGLSEAQEARLSGFTRRAMEALAHLREAWVVADSSNARAIEAALRGLMRGHSFAVNADLIRTVLSHRLMPGRAAELLYAGSVPGAKSPYLKDVLAEVDSAFARVDAAEANAARVRKAVAALDKEDASLPYTPPSAEKNFWSEALKREAKAHDDEDGS